MSLDQNQDKLDSGQQTIHKYLVIKSKEGDRRAQSELYGLYAKAMYNICRRLMGDEDEAKDALQDAFVDAFLKIHTLENENLFSAWIKRIVVNKCINTLRKRKLNMVQIDDRTDFVEEADDTDFQKYEAKRIMRAIDQISEGCRTVLNLYLFEGYDHKEIGEILGVTESASKAQYSKAKAKIRNLLTDDNSMSYG
jgi:RNA polymerase sigma-70 factor (ECF subfamily)